MLRNTMSHTRHSAPGMPPLSDVLKSREVEDPVNLWVHRPLAYAFCRLVYRTPMTPNQITLLAIALGLAAAACWVEGSPRMMVWGGVLLWSSAIMDGADGILARAKNMQSAFGRAIDGVGDWLVGLSSVAACIYHLRQSLGLAEVLALGLPVVLISIVQFNQYDFYKEVHVHMTRLDKRREGHSMAEVELLRSSEEVRSGPWYTRLAMMFYADFTRAQNFLVNLTNPAAKRLLAEFPRSEQSAATYRRYNWAPMQLWKAMSTAPHAYLFSIFGMFDRLALYIWLRLTLFGMLLVLTFVLQRRATSHTLSAFQAHGWLSAA
jgi:phosphatidylglycerophosphate synthase